LTRPTSTPRSLRPGERGGVIGASDKTACDSRLSKSDVDSRRVDCKIADEGGITTESEGMIVKYLPLRQLTRTCPLI
jgi:hypothetical protein